MVRETRHLWVGNLPDNIREDRIREHFKRYGRVQSVKLLAKGGGAEAGGAGVCAAVAFMDIKSAAKAHTAGHTLDERALTTDYYEPAAIPSSAGSSPAGSGYSASSGSVNSAHARHSVAGEEVGAGAWRALEGEAGAGYARRAATPAYRDRLYRNGPAAYAQHQDRTSTPSVRSWYAGAGAAAAVAAAAPAVGGAVRMRRRSGSAASAASASSRSSSSSRTPSSPDSRASRPATPARHHNSHQWSSSSNRAFAICVRNLPARSSDSSLKDGLYHEYKKHGKVAWVKVVGQNQDRYAVVRFKKPSDVEKALEVSQDKSFFGCKISVAPYQGCDADDSEAARPYEMDLDEYHPKATRTLFIGNLEKDVTPTMLRDKFHHFGRIIEIDIKKQSGGSAGYAFCQYASISSVVEAIRTMDGEHVGSSRVKLGFGKSMATTCVWIDGLADQTEKQVAAIVTRYGPISSLTVDRAAGAALAHYEQAAAAAQAVRDLRQRPTVPTTPRLMVDFASRESQEAFYETLENQGGTTTPCLAGALSERLSSAERFSEGRTFEPGLATPQSRYTRYDSSGSRSYTRSAPRTPRYTPLADHYDATTLDYSSDRRYRSYEDIGGSSSPTEEAVTSATAAGGVAAASGGYESEPRCLLQSVIVASPRRRPPRHHRHRSPHDSSPDDSKRFKELHWAGSGRRSSGEVRHRSRSGERRRRGSDAERRRHRRRRDDSPGSRAGTPLCDELPDAPAPAEPRRPPAPPRDRLHQPMSLPLPKFAAQVLRAVPAQTPPPAPSTAPASPPRAPSASSSSGGSAPHSPSLEERIRSLDEKYEKWSGSRAAAAEAAERGRFRHRLLDLDINEVKPSDVVRSLLAKRSVFDEDSERLEGAAALERRAPSPSEGPRALSGGREAARPAPRALQYPFPSHPPSAPSSEEVAKPATPPAAPHPASDTDGAPQPSQCVNDRVPSIGALVADSVHSTVPKSYPSRNTSGCSLIDSKLYKFGDTRKDSSNLGSVSDVELVSKDTERSKLCVNSDNLDRRKYEVGDVIKVNRTDVDNLEVDLRDHNINSKLVNPDRNISDKKFSDVDKISKHEKFNTSLSQIDRKQEFHKLDTKYLHKIPLPLEKSHSDITDKRKYEKQDKERTDHERENRRYDLDKKKQDTWNLFPNQVSVSGKDTPDRDRDKQETTVQIDDRHKKYEHDKKSVDSDRERDKRDKIEKENCEKDFSRSDKDHVTKEKERDRIEKERLEIEKAEREKALKERERMERERIEKEKIERELAEKEKEKLEREKSEKAEKERLEKERERVEKHIEREKLEKERLERERERIQRERLEREKLEREKAEKDKTEREKSERERAEREKAERDQIEKERLEKEQAERERAERERAEQERAERERAERERAERERAERDRVEREQAERDKAEREKAEKEKSEREKTEKENADREKAEREKADKERAKDMEKACREKVEKDNTDKERVDKKVDDKSLRNETRRDRSDRKREEKDHTDCNDTSTIKDKRKDRDASDAKAESKHKYQGDKHRKDHSEGRKEARKDSKDISRKSSRDETPREIVRKDSSDSTASRASHDSSKSKDHDNLFEPKDDSKHGSSRSKQSHEATHRHRHEKDFLPKISGKEGDTKRNDSDKILTDKLKDRFQISDEKVSDHKQKEKLGFDVQIQRHYSLDSQNVESKRKERLNSSSSLPSSIGSKRRMSSQDRIDSSLDEPKKSRPSDCKITERRDSKDSKHSEKSKHPKLSKMHYAKILEDKIKDEKKHIVKSNEESKSKLQDAKETENKQITDKCKSAKRSPKIFLEEKMFSPSHDLCKQEMPEIRNDIVSSRDIEFLATLELRSSEEDEKQKALRKEMKEKKRIHQLQQIQQLQMQQDAMQHSEMFSKLKDDKRLKNDERKKDVARDKRMSTERKSREDGPNKQNDLRKKTRKTLNSSDTSDSDEPKKHSIFDIVDDEPTYISMYDKVKARSCKNMQKQEEEKRQEKIKAKFSQFKQCRAKREEKKRSTSWDEDSDSDHERKKSSQKLLMNSSSEDERGMRRHSRKDATDSENDIEKCKLGDEKIIDYNDSTNDADKNKLCRKNSRSRIMSDTSDEENVKRTLQKINKKVADFTQIKSELFFDNEEEYIFSKNKDVKCNVKKEIDEKFNKSSLANLFNDNFIPTFEEKKPIFGNEITSVLDVTIKTEPGIKLECDLKPNMIKMSINDISSEGESNNKIHSSMSDLRKKHKKKQKRSKCSLSEDESKLTDTNEKSPTIEGESKHRFSIEKSRRHSNKKEKRREKLRESFDGEDDKGKMKKNKKSSSIFDNKSESTNSSKREDKMEDIFGPLSDESDGGHKCNNSHATFNNKLFSPKTSNNDYESMGASFDSKVLNEYSAKEKAREESRRRKDRKRKEKKSVVREDENSLDVDAAGKAIEASLFADSMTENESQNIRIKTEPVNHKLETDVFRFTDGDDSLESSLTTELKAVEKSRRELKEKKKKKKRSKEDRQSRREHHHHHHEKSDKIEKPIFVEKLIKQSPDLTIKTEPDNSVKTVGECKPALPSPSLPRLTESPPLFKPVKPEVQVAIAKESSQVPVQLENKEIDQPTKMEVEDVVEIVKKELSPPPAAVITEPNDDIKPASICKTSLSKPGEIRRLSEKFIPGFGGNIDETISENAVKSISEFESPSKERKDSITESTMLEDDSDTNKLDEKSEEKPRAVISQEETEDAVAALLGESFGGNNSNFGGCYNEGSQSPTDPGATVSPVNDNIPEEDAEEMRRAVQNLNASELEMKPDTPMSETDLQIDTDTDDAEEAQHESLDKVSEHSSTPQVSTSVSYYDMKGGFGKSASTTAPSTIEKQIFDPHKMTVNNLRAPPIMNKGLELGNLSRDTSNIVSAANESLYKPQMKIESLHQITSTATPVISTTWALGGSNKPRDPQIMCSTNQMINREDKTIHLATNILQLKPTSQTMALNTQCRPVMTSHARVPAPYQVINQMLRPPNHMANLQPPTIKIPDQHIMYQKAQGSIVISPRMSNEVRMHSPKTTTHGDMTSPRMGNVTILNASSNLNSPPGLTSSNVLPQRSPGHVTVVRMQQPPLSPIQTVHLPNQHCNRSMLSPNRLNSVVVQNQTNPVHLNRIPVTPVLAPLSKPLHANNVLTQQSKPMSVTNTNLIQPPKLISTSDARKNEQRSLQESLMGNTKIILSPGMQQSQNPTVLAQNRLISMQNAIHNTNLGSGMNVTSNKLIYNNSVQVPDKREMQNLGYKGEVPKPDTINHLPFGQPPPIIHIATVNQNPGSVIQSGSKPLITIGQESYSPGSRYPSNIIHQMNAQRTSTPAPMPTVMHIEPNKSQQTSVLSVGSMRPPGVLTRVETPITSNVAATTSVLSNVVMTPLLVKTSQPNMKINSSTEEGKFSNLENMQFYPKTLYMPSVYKTEDMLPKSKHEDFHSINRDSDSREKKIITSVSMSQVTPKLPIELPVQETDFEELLKDTTNEIKVERNERKTEISVTAGKSVSQYTTTTITNAFTENIRRENPIKHCPPIETQPAKIFNEKVSIESSVSKINHIDAKHDNWFPKGLNIESVIKNVDKLCSSDVIQESSSKGHSPVPDIVKKVESEPALSNEKPADLPDAPKHSIQSEAAGNKQDTVSKVQDKSVIDNIINKSHENATDKPLKPVPDETPKPPEHTPNIGSSLKEEPIMSEAKVEPSQKTGENTMTIKPAHDELTNVVPISVVPTTTVSTTTVIESPQFMKVSEQKEQNMVIDNAETKSSIIPLKSKGIDHKSLIATDLIDNTSELIDIRAKITSSKRAGRMRGRRNDRQLERVQTRQIAKPLRNTGTSRRGRGRGKVDKKIKTTPSGGFNMTGDIYDFHEDSGDETDSSPQNKSESRPRLILTIKSPLSGPVNASANSTTANLTLPPKELPLSPEKISPITPSAANKDEGKVEDFASPAVNTRKSRRLLEKDGNRNTVDEVIDDVIKNMSGQSRPSLTKDSNTRRTTRQNGAKAGALEKSTIDVRKSPRGTKRRCTSETSIDSSDEKPSKKDLQDTPPESKLPKMADLNVAPQRDSPVISSAAATTASTILTTTTSVAPTMVTTVVSPPIPITKPPKKMISEISAKLASSAVATQPLEIIPSVANQSMEVNISSREKNGADLSKVPVLPDKQRDAMPVDKPPQVQIKETPKPVELKRPENPEELILDPASGELLYMRRTSDGTFQPIAGIAAASKLQSPTQVPILMPTPSSTPGTSRLTPDVSTPALKIDYVQVDSRPASTPTPMVVHAPIVSSVAVSTIQSPRMQYSAIVPGAYERKIYSPVIQAQTAPVRLMPPNLGGKTITISSSGVPGLVGIPGMGSNATQSIPLMQPGMPNIPGGIGNVASGIPSMPGNVVNVRGAVSRAACAAPVRGVPPRVRALAPPAALAAAGASLPRGAQGHAPSPPHAKHIAIVGPQPIAGANNSRAGLTSVPSVSPQSQIPLGDGLYPHFSHQHYQAYQHYRAQHESRTTPSPYVARSPLGAEGSEAPSPPLELRRPPSARVPRPAHSPSPCDRLPVGGCVARGSPPPAHGGARLPPALPPPGPPGPPHASQVPREADSLQMLLRRYPVMWQGLLALKNDAAAVQMHFVGGNPHVAAHTLPRHVDGSTPPLRIAQRMRLEPVQLEAVHRKMQLESEHCMLLALPCGRDHMDVLQQSTNLTSGFITYLQRKQAAGIVNVAPPGHHQAMYTVHIFPSCDFANENLDRIAPDLLHRVTDIAHLLIVIATV